MYLPVKINVNNKRKTLQCFRFTVSVTRLPNERPFPSLNLPIDGPYLRPLISGLQFYPAKVPEKLLQGVILHIKKLNFDSYSGNTLSSFCFSSSRTVSASCNCFVVSSLTVFSSVSISATSTIRTLQCD